MARKRRSRRRQRHTRRTAPPQPAKARKALQDGQYKTAINIYKALLKGEQKAEWIEALAEAYAGRGWELAAKGMFKEAVTIWRNRAQTCNQSLVNGHYLLWLLQAGDIDEALRLYQDHERALGREIQPLRAHLAALALAGKQEILRLLPAEDPVVRDHTAALQALQAYCDGDGAGLKTALGRIAFRSPYRDLSTLLKALLEKTAHPETAQDLLSRIDDRSPFVPLALTVKASICDGEQMLKALAPLDPSDRRFALTLKGWPESQFVFLQELIALQQSSEDRHLLRFLIQQQKILGEDFSRQAAMRFISHHPESSRAYNRSFGMPDPYDRARISALTDDDEPHFGYEDHDAWSEVLYYFKRTFDSEDRQNKLRTALLLRKIAEIQEKDHPEEEELEETLEESLEFDPDDPPTYLRLIRLYRENRRFKEARRIQEQALARYPQDTEVLLAIVETSIASNAYKKAATFARRILTIDPINPKVRKILFDAHLAHARKQIKQAKPALALKELEQAGQWDETQPAKNQIEFILGIMELNHDKPAGIKRLQQTMVQLNHSLKDRFLLLMEAERLQRRPGQILKLLKFPSFKGDPGQVMELAHTLQAQPKEDEEEACNALRHLHQPLKKSARFAYQQQDMDLLCEVFKRYGQPQLRQQYAKVALKHWPKTPLFVYHRLDTQLRLRNKDYRDLEQALDQANETGDMRTAHRINELLKTSFSFGEPAFPESGPGDNIDDEFIKALINEMGAEGFLDILESLNLPDFDTIRENVGDDQLSKLFERIADGEDPIEEARGPFPNPFKKPRKRPRGKPRKSTTKTGAGAKDDDANQLDLF
ncbi:MAG: hypothetical protein GY807_06100 [Gammaproteobacteria bacterium]|nr:hypothetical protein [Gammaproteobacteria bacterium]